MTEELSQISEREREILQIVASGATNQQIAQKLHISVHTVKVHLRNIYSKIGVESRTEATVYAVRHGLVQVPQTTPNGKGQATVAEPAAVADPAAPAAEEPAAPAAEEPAPPAPNAASTSNEDLPPAALSPDIPTTQPLGSSAVPSAPSAPAEQPVPEAAQPPVSDTAQLLSQSPSQSPSRPTSQPSSSSNTPAPKPHPLMHHPVLLILLAGLSIVLALALAVTLMQQQDSTASPTTLPTTLPQATIVPATNQLQAAPERWNSHESMAEPRSHFAVVPYDYDGKIYVIGGAKDGVPDNAVQRYDPNNAVWVTLNPKPTAVSHIQAATIGGLIYVPGGEGNDGSILDVFEAYDPRNKRWERLPPLPAPRSQYALTSFEGQLYLFGGWDGERYCAEVFIYDPYTETWREGESLPTPRRNAGAAVAEDRIYIIGGENGDGSLALNERYDATSGGQYWESAAPLPMPIAKPAVAAVVNTFFVFDAEERTAQQYTPSTDAWATLVLPENVATPAQVAPLRSSLFTFSSQDDEETPGAVSEYRAVFMLFLPDVRK